MCWGAGILLSSGVVRAVAGIDGDLGWRLPFVLQWIWPIPLFIGAYFAPESPWNAVRRDKIDLARDSLMRLRGDSPNKELEVESALAYIRHTTAIEKAETADASFMECFQGTNLRRTEIVSPKSPFCKLGLVLIQFLRTVWFGLHRFYVAMPSLGTRWSSLKQQAFLNCKHLTSIFLFPPAT